MARAPGQVIEAFELSHVAKAFSNGLGLGQPTPALAEVTLSGASGERIALLGPNGSGKSTLLRLLGGLLSADGGSVRVLAGDPRASPQVRAGLGLCTGDERSLLLRLTPRENLRFSGALYGLAGAELQRRIEALGGQLGLTAQLDRPTYTLSSGNRARLLLGRALLHEPRLILLDEGTHALDSEGAEGLRQLLRARTEAGACLLFVTHNEAEARALATRTVRLENGRLTGSPPTSALTAALTANASPTPIALALAWIRKATLEELSYRGYLALEAIGGLVTLLGLYYFSRLVGSARANLIGSEGYFAFACVGLAAYLPTRTAQAEVARQVRAAQLVGLLEPLAASPPTLPAQLLAMAVQPTLGALARAGLTLLAGSVLFGLRLDPAGLGWTLLALGLAAAASAGLGLCSAAVVLHVRRSDPVAYLLDAAAWLASGLLFPVALLPHWTQTLSELLPATHALRLVRGTLLPGGPPSTVGPELGALAALAAVALTVGWGLLSVALRAARRSGALGIS